jgi:hypothetical protein
MKSKHTTEKKLEAKLQNLLERVLSPRGGSVATFEECGVMTNNRGLVLTLPSQDEFQITIVQSR